MNITDEAKHFIKSMMKEAGVSTLRFASSDAGCCGPSYQLALEKPQENDTVSLINEVEVAIDAKVVDLVSAITLDLVQDEQGAGLTISGGSSCC